MTGRSYPIPRALARGSGGLQDLEVEQEAEQLGSAGQVFSLFVIAVAAAEVGVGLALVLLIYRNRRDVNFDQLDELKG